MPETQYFHGGAPRLKIGDFLLPSCITGASTTADHGAEKVCRRDRVYITTQWDTAMVFAAMHPSNKGCIYRVEPSGELEADPDCSEPGESFQCEKARIVAVCEMKGSTRAKIRKNMIRLYEFEPRPQ